MSTPAISVVTIFRDAEPYLGEAVASVQAQTRGDWELVLVDDGSTDGSGALAERLAAQDARLSVVRHPGGVNRGMSASRNLGVRTSRGDLVAFLDADDVYLPHKLERQAALLERHPEVDLVYGPMTLWSSWDGTPGVQDRVRHTRAPLGRPLAPGSLLVPYLTGAASTPATCSVLLRRSAFERVGGFEERFRGMFEDQVFFCKASLHLRCLVTDEPLDLYRQHAASTSATSLAAGTWARDAPNPARAAFLQWLAGYLQDQGVHDAPVLRALQRELRPYRRPRLAALERRARAAVRRFTRR